MLDITKLPNLILFKILNVRKVIPFPKDIVALIQEYTLQKPGPFVIEDVIEALENKMILSDIEIYQPIKAFTFVPNYQEAIKDIYCRMIYTEQYINKPHLLLRDLYLLICKSKICIRVGYDINLVNKILYKIPNYSMIQGAHKKIYKFDEMYNYVDADENICKINEQLQLQNTFIQVIMMAISTYAPAHAIITSNKSKAFLELVVIPKIFKDKKLLEIIKRQEKIIFVINALLKTVNVNEAEKTMIFDVLFDIMDKNSKRTEIVIMQQEVIETDQHGNQIVRVVDVPVPMEMQQIDVVYDIHGNPM